MLLLSALMSCACAKSASVVPAAPDAVAVVPATPTPVVATASAPAPAPTPAPAPAPELPGQVVAPPSDDDGSELDGVFIVADGRVVLEQDLGPPWADSSFAFVERGKRDKPWTARGDLIEAQVPRRLAGLVGQVVEVYDATHVVCHAKVGALSVEGHGFYTPDYLAVGDAPYRPDAEVLEHMPRTLVGELARVDGNCRKGIWAVAPGAPRPRVFAAAKRDLALERAALAAFRALPEWEARQVDRADRGPWDAPAAAHRRVRHLVGSGESSEPVELVLVGAALMGDTCLDLDLELNAVFRVQRAARGAPSLALIGTSDSPAALGVVDLRGDGTLRLVSEQQFVAARVGHIVAIADLTHGEQGDPPIRYDEPELGIFPCE